MRSLLKNIHSYCDWSINLSEWKQLSCFNVWLRYYCKTANPPSSICCCPPKIQRWKTYPYRDVAWIFVKWKNIFVLTSTSKFNFFFTPLVMVGSDKAQWNRWTRWRVPDDDDFKIFINLSDIPLSQPEGYNFWLPFVIFGPQSVHIRSRDDSEFTLGEWSKCLRITLGSIKWLFQKIELIFFVKCVQS